MAARRSPGEVRDAVSLLDSAFAPLTPAEQLEVGRAAGNAGSHSARPMRSRRPSRPVSEAEDRFGFATTLTRLGRHADAARQFALVLAPRDLAATAAYQRARALVRPATPLGAVGRSPASFGAPPRYHGRLLRSLPPGRPRLGRPRRRPGPRLLPPGRHPLPRVAIRAHGGLPRGHDRAPLGPARLAATEFDGLARRYPRSDEPCRGLLGGPRLGGRRQQRRGPRPLGAPPTASPAPTTRPGPSRLHRHPWAPPAAPDSFVADPGRRQRDGPRRVARSAWPGTRVRWEYDRLVRQSDTSPSGCWRSPRVPPPRSRRPVDPARAPRHRAGRAPDARPIGCSIRGARGGATRGGRGPRPRRWVRGRAHPAGIHVQSRGDLTGRRARADAGHARPGRPAGGVAGVSVWDPVLLYQPDVSLQLGAFHLQELTGRYAQPVHVLAAYNAGASRVERWSQRIGVDDPEVFTERIRSRKPADTSAPSSATRTSIGACTRGPGRPAEAGTP